VSIDVAQFALRVGDDAVVTAQRLAEWSGRAPEMEEDVALSNIALDQVGVARLMFSYAAELFGGGDNTGEDTADEDTLAFERDDHQYRNCLLAELPNAGPNAGLGAKPDFAPTIVRLLLLCSYQQLLYEALSGSTDARLAGIAAKASKESAYHVEHATLWTVRLGDGTDESHRRMQKAVDELWPFTHELFADDELTTRLAGAGVVAVPESLKAPWRQATETTLAQATLQRPADGWAPLGGREGRHTEHLSYLLGEMQVLHRAHPGARW
jgi:ring-1,2-phenylacetyl-CoA epoxidase subunit PaaC